MKDIYDNLYDVQDDSEVSKVIKRTENGETYTYELTCQRVPSSSTGILRIAYTN